ncbi:MAG: hypothetical protein IPP37_14950 [Saprospiraceae bacterium]|nr:hypothetical protein [Saprospiraceae bacterium]
MKRGQHFSVFGRLEYFEEKDQVQITSLNGVVSLAPVVSLGIDYKLKDNALLDWKERKIFL